MNIPAITIGGMLICLALATTAAAQGTPGGKSSQGAPKTQLSEIRSIVHDLEGRTEKLRDLMSQYRSLVEERPQGNEAQTAKWNAALERLLRRMDEARAAVAETTQRLDQAINGQVLPTAVGKDVANARNEAEAQRTGAEQALAKNKSARTKPAKQPVAEKPAPPIPDDL